jgi:2-keto-4-pentenoate hydratase
MTETNLAAATEHAAELLAEAQKLLTAVEPVRQLIPTKDVEAAYAVQEINIKARERAGARRVGRKIGLTNVVVQTQFGVDEPDYGVLMDDMEITNHGLVPFGTMIDPRIEAEIAFVLKKDIREATPEAVWDAVAYATPCLEIVDSRIRNWDINIVDTIADNASSAYYVLGDGALPLEDFAPAAASMTLRRDGVEVTAGSGADSMGDPLTALLWVAETALRQNLPLMAGEVILSGSLGRMVPLPAGSTFSSDISGLGNVTVTVSAA